jgi:FkbM family methyltransferase
MTPPVEAFRNGRRFILCSLICGSNLLSTPITIIDVGALDSFADPRWTKLPADKIRLHGFEPDGEECARLNEQASASGLDFRFHPIALAGSAGRLEFIRYEEPAANSFYLPNEALINRWCYQRSLPLSSQFRIREKCSIEAVPLLDWSNLSGITDFDFIKLNIQGAELDVLMGAGKLLEQVAGMLVEQTFNPTYVGAPMFGKVYNFIEDAGFTMFDVVGMNHVGRLRSPIHITEDKIFGLNGGWARHQFFEGHFLYLRDALRSGDAWQGGIGLPLEKCLKLACIAEVFGQIEFAFEILDWIACSPQASGVATEVRKIIQDGASLYREAVGQSASVSSDSDRDERVLAAMNSTFTVRERLESAAKEQIEMKSDNRRMKSEICRLQDELSAIKGDNRRLIDALESQRLSRLIRGAGRWLTKSG